MSGHRALNRSSIHAYSATKYAVRAIAQGLRNELQEKVSAIRVSTISPGMVKTDFYHRLYNESPNKGIETYKEYTPLQSEDIVKVLIYVIPSPFQAQIHDILINPTEAKI